MKSLLIIVIVFVLGGLVGSKLGPTIAELMGGSGDMSMENSSEPTEKKPLYWVAPMDKNYRRDEPGQSPMGMDLVPVYEEGDAGEEGSVSISAVLENNLGVKTGKVSKTSLIMPIDTVGTVQFDESKITHIHSRVEGWIEVLNVKSAGDTVKKGQTLYELYSPALVNAQEEYLAALRSGNKNIIKASKSRLMSLGLDDKQAKRLKQRRRVDQRIKVVAEQDGVIIDLNVRQGMHIKPSTQVLSFGSLDSVWVLGEIFERQSYLIKTGQDVDIHFNAMPEKVWKGTLNYIYPQLDSKTRTLTIRVRLANPDHALKPNMLANLRVLNRSEQTSLSIPKQALIKAGKHTRVVKSLGDGRYKSVLVEAGYEGIAESLETTHSGSKMYDDRVQILKGLNEGDSVVTSAQFLIDSESNIDAELARLEKDEPSFNMGSSEKSSVLNTVRSSGKVNKIMATRVNLTHEPIPEWDWPTMKMDFQVAQSVDLSKIQEGDMIEFEVQKSKDFDYLILTINKVVKK